MLSPTFKYVDILASTQLICLAIDLDTSMMYLLLELLFIWIWYF